MFNKVINKLEKWYYKFLYWKFGKENVDNGYLLTYEPYYIKIVYENMCNDYRSDLFLDSDIKRWKKKVPLFNIKNKLLHLLIKLPHFMDYVFYYLFFFPYNLYLNWWCTWNCYSTSEIPNFNFHHYMKGSRRLSRRVVGESESSEIFFAHKRYGKLYNPVGKELPFPDNTEFYYEDDIKKMIKHYGKHCSPYSKEARLLFFHHIGEVIEHNDGYITYRLMLKEMGIDI